MESIRFSEWYRPLTPAEHAEHDDICDCCLGETKLLFTMGDWDPVACLDCAVWWLTSEEFRMELAEMEGEA